MGITSTTVEKEYARVLYQTAALASILSASQQQAYAAGKPALASNYAVMTNDLDEVGRRILTSQPLKEVLLNNSFYPVANYADDYGSYIDAVIDSEMPRLPVMRGWQDIFGVIDEYSEALFQKVMITAAKAIAADRRDIYRELTSTTDAAYTAAKVMYVLNDIQNGLLSNGTELIFVPDRLPSYEDGAESLRQFADADGVYTKFGTKILTFAHTEAGGPFRHGSAANIGQGDGHFYRCGSQESYDYISRSLQAFRNGIQLR